MPAPRRLPLAAAVVSLVVAGFTPLLASTPALAANAPSDTLYFHSASGSYQQDSAADPGAALSRAPQGSTLTTAAPTKSAAATAMYDAGVYEGTAGLPTFSLPVGGVVSSVCLDLYVSTNSGAVDGQIDTRTSFYSKSGSLQADTVLTSSPYSSGILHLRGLVKPNSTMPYTAEAGGAFSVATYINTNLGYTLYYDSTDMPSSITLNPTSCTPLPGAPQSIPVQPTPTDAAGLSFGASVTADPQRSESEPNMEIDAAGNIYTCGPTGFSNADDYAQVSTDGGDQFHLLGTPPRGQQGTGGGGDCGLATSIYKNAQGKYTYAYTGLGPLTGFTTSSSPDYGHTLTNGGPQGNTDSGQGVLTDRQWMVFTGPNTVLLSYNQQQPRNVVVQKSTDGGVTYGPNGVLAAPNPLFPGPMRILPAELNPANNGQPLVYFPWNKGNNANLSISQDGGTTWTDCLVAVSKNSPSAGFMTADNDVEGNLYFAYTDKGTYQTYLTVLTHDKIAGCNNPVGTVLSPGNQPTNNPGWSAPIQVNQGAVKTTVFPWLVAGGAPGRVAVAYYGTETAGDPNVGTFKATWDVYVDQSLDALNAPNLTLSQVKATTHPLHYDSICLNGLGCSTSTPSGDRSLGDFFALDYNPVTHKLSVVYDQSSKKPDEASGRLATPAVITQNGGPSNGGEQFDLGVVPTRDALRQSSVDPTGDALAQYSNLDVTPTPVNEPAGDFTSVNVGPEVNPTTGAAVANGGFTVTMKLADLSAAALQKEMTDTGSLSLLWTWRFVNGFTASAATAFYSPSGGWTFGYNDYTTGTCGGGSCQQYRGTTPVPGKVDAASGTITISVPRSLLRALSGPTGAGQRPTEVPATDGTRFYDGTAFSLGNAQATQTNQSYLYPLDSTPSMDFLLGATDNGAPGPVVPEAPFAVLLPLAGVALAGALVVVRRRRLG